MGAVNKLDTVVPHQLAVLILGAVLTGRVAEVFPAKVDLTFDELELPKRGAFLDVLHL